MSVESFDDDLRRGVVHWPRPERIVLEPPDDTWPATYAAHRAELDRLGPVEHIGATAVPGLPAVPVVDLLLVLDDPAAATRDLLALGYEPWFVDAGVRAFRQGLPTGTAVSLRVGRPDDAVGYLALRDHLVASATARRRYTEVRRGLVGTWSDLRDYVTAKGPLVRALLAEA